MRRSRLWHDAPPSEHEDQFQEVALVLCGRDFESETHLRRALWMGLGFRAKDFWKAARRREVPVGEFFEPVARDPSGDGVEEEAALAADSRIVDDCLSELDDRERAVYRLVRGQELSRRRVARLLGIDEPSVLRALYSAQRKIDRFVVLHLSGRLCADREGAVAALARDAADEVAWRQARAHLAHCPSCMVAFREYRAALSRRVAALLPLPALAPPAWDQLVEPVRTVGQMLKRQLYAMAGRGPPSSSTTEAVVGGGAGSAVAAKVVLGCVGVIAGGGAVCATTLDLFDGPSKAPVATRSAERRGHHPANRRERPIVAATHDPPPAPAPSVARTATTRSPRAKRAKVRSRRSHRSRPSQPQQEFFDAPNGSSTTSTGSAPVHESSATPTSSSGGSSTAPQSGGGEEFFGG